MSLNPLSASRLLAVAALAAVALPSQRVVRQQVVLGVAGGVAPGPERSADDDPGRPVEMFENPNLDRYLRRAQLFFEREDFASAIAVLQDVIEGRTLEVMSDGDGAGAGAAPDVQAAEQPNKDESDAGRRPGPVSPYSLDARNSVFSHDGRLYRPVSRLCHELLAKMPEVGVQIYRTNYEFAASELLDQALVEGSTSSLEQVVNRFFITLPSGRAMAELADRLMHEGRYRSAVQVLRDLLEVYPEANRRQLGIRDAWCRFKIALCLQLAGEHDAARAAVDLLAADLPEESLRVLGQLESVRELPQSALFQRDTVRVEAAPSSLSQIAAIGPEVHDLVGIWQYRFRDPEPYRGPKPSSRNRPWAQQQLTAMPFAARYGPATWMAFDTQLVDGRPVPRALFLENFCLRLADAASGLLLRATERSDQPPVAREGHPRARIAASDFALLRPIRDEARYYVVVGQENNTTQSEETLKVSELVAYSRDDWRQVWTSKDWLDGDDGLREVTFLAAPTVFGERLLLPALRRKAYSLECLDRSTGRPLWHALLHGGGSEFYKAPGTPVAVQGGIAFVATNAGCVAAVDAFAGDLRWIRRYERRDPVHKAAAVRTQENQEYVMPFAERELRNFLPADLVLHEGLLVVAPCDGEVLFAVDVANGEPVWMLDGRTRFAPYGTLRTVIGADDKCLFALSDTHLVAIELAGGLVRWCRDLPSWDGPKFSGRGRGCVTGGNVIVPGVRELLVFDAAGGPSMRRLAMPVFGASREPLEGSYNVVVDGPWMAVGYQGGVEVYSSAPALRELATVTADSLDRSLYLSLAGEPVAAESELTKTIRAGAATSQGVEAQRRLLTLRRDHAMQFAAGGDIEAALEAMDGIGELIDDRPLRLKWHLARIELCKAAGAMRRHAIEQQSLYDFMEGRG